MWSYNRIENEDKAGGTKRREVDIQHVESNPDSGSQETAFQGDLPPTNYSQKVKIGGK